MKCNQTLSQCTRSQKSGISKLAKRFQITPFIAKSASTEPKPTLGKQPSRARFKGDPPRGGAGRGRPAGGRRAGQLPFDPGGRRRRAATRRSIGTISANCCSFLAASVPIFARKYAFCSIFQILPDYQAEFFEIRQNFANLPKFSFKNFSYMLVIW